MAAGLIGVPLGSMLAQRLRPTIENCDPYICAVGLFISAPMVFLGLIMASTSGTWCFIFVFMAQVALNMSWSIVADILLVRQRQRLPAVLPTATTTTSTTTKEQLKALGNFGLPKIEDTCRGHREGSGICCLYINVLYRSR